MVKKVKKRLIVQNSLIMVNKKNHPMARTIQISEL